MKAAVVLHSQTGHTILFARAIAEQFAEAGYEADIELLRPTKFVRPNSRDVQLRRTPDISEYDIVLIGGPVWAFNASPVTFAFLSSLQSLKGKRAAAFVTYSLPFRALGCTPALSRISGTLKVLGAKVVEGEGVLWLLRPGKKHLEHAARRLVMRLIAPDAEPQSGSKDS